MRYGATANRHSRPNTIAKDWLAIGVHGGDISRMPKPVVVYTYARCSTCRDAVKWLTAHGVPFQEKPIYETPPGVAELKQMLARNDGQVRRLFNTSGLEYKALELKSKLPTLSEADALALLASNGKLVKRPFLLGANVGLVGFKPHVWATALDMAR